MAADLTNLAAEVESLRVARLNIAKWNEVKEAMEERIKEAMGDEPEGTIDGHTVITYKPSEPGVTLDVKKLQAELPAAVLAPYLMTKRAARPFKVVD